MIQVTPGHGGSFSHSPQVLSNLPWPKTCHLPRIGRGLLWPVNNREFSNMDLIDSLKMRVFQRASEFEAKKTNDSGELGQVPYQRSVKLEITHENQD